MAYLGRPGATAPLTSADIPDDSITAAKIVDGAIDFQDEIGFLENKATTQNLSGTYSTERMYLNDSYTLTGDVTITGHLALGTVADSDVVITQDSTQRTITGSGTLEAGELLHRPDTSDLTGMTGELGSAVTGSPNLNLGNATFPAFAKSFFVKGWVTFNQSSNTILSSYNVSSISHPATGRTIINWDTDFGSANYAISGMASDSSNPLIMTLYNASGAITSSSVQIMVQYQNFNLADGTFVSVMAIGD